MPDIMSVFIGAGLGGTLPRASCRATLARSLSGDARRAANALLNATMGLISLVGPGVGAVLATATSPQTALAATGAAGVLAAAFALAASRHPLGLAPAGSAAAKPGAAAAADAQVDDHTVAPPGERAPDPLPLPLPLLLALTAVISTGLAMDEPALLPYSEQSLDAGPGGYGAILSCWGLGIIVGSLAFSRVLHGRMIALAAGGTALSALGYLGLAAAPTIEVACVIAVIGGVGNGFNWVSLVTAVQEATPDDRQGQAASRLEAIITVGPALGYLLGGTIADAASPRLTLLIPGVLALAVLALGVALVAAKNRGRRAAAAPAGVDAAP